MRTGGMFREAAITSEGLRVGFRTNSGDLLAKISSVFVPDSAPIDFTKLDFIYSLKELRRDSYSAYHGSRVLLQRASLTAALDSIDCDLQHTIAKHSRDHLFLHAGVLGWRQRAILFPGRTCTGKSTLINALIRAGAVYFSDEFARIDARGWVHPFCRPLSLRTPRGKLTVHPEQEGLQIADGPYRIGAIVATHYSAGRAWCPTRLSPGQAALELLSNAVAVRSDPIKAVEYVGKLVSSARAISSPRGEAEATVPVLFETLERLLD